MNLIHDYAVIGDCRTAALVSRNGSIDWLCWPRFDSPSIFGALLDDAAGRWSLAPAAPLSSTRMYVDGTNGLQTRFQSSSGSVVITDLMPVASEEEKRTLLVPDHEILRVVECERGEVDIELRLEPRPNYARHPPRIQNAGSLGIRIETRDGLLVLRTDVPVDRCEDGCVRGGTTLRAGQRLHASLTFADDWPAVLPPLGDWSRQAVARSIAWWQDWASRISYTGPAREAVVRSALVLKLLAYAPSGAVVAAPRMNLPYMLGTIFTPNRDRAKVIGFGVHLAMGWLFSFVYIAAFHAWGRATWGLGAGIGFVHAAFVLTAGMRLMPGMHPRMASEQQGPTVMRQLEPPGFLALNYGYQTPVSVMVAHVVFGMILGAFYMARSG